MKCRLLVLAALLPAIVAQPPIQLNTTLRSFTLTTGGMADVWTYIDGIGREFALICTSSNGLHVYEITNPDAPVFADSVPTTGFDLKDVKVEGNHAFVVQESGDAFVVDMTDPYNLAVVGAVPGIGAHNGEVQNGYWALASVGCGTAIYSIANPAAPALVSCISGSSHDVTLDDDRLYVHSFSGTRTLIYDFSNPSTPVQLGTIPYGNHSGAFYDPPGTSRTLMVCNESLGGHCQIWDVTDGANPVYLSSYITPGGGSISVHNPVEMGRYVCIAYYADYLRIVDMGNPSAPVEVGIYDPWPTNVGASLFAGCWGAVPLKELPGGGWRIVVGDRQTPRGFYVVDFTPPPTLDLTATTSGNGDFAFGIAGADPGSDVYNLFSVQTGGPLGAGTFLGLGPDAFFLLLNPLLGPPIKVPADATGSWSFNLPAGSVPGGLSLDLRSIGPVGGTYLLSDVARIGF